MPTARSGTVPRRRPAATAAAAVCFLISMATAPPTSGARCAFRQPIARGQVEQLGSRSLDLCLDRQIALEDRLFGCFRCARGGVHVPGLPWGKSCILANAGKVVRASTSAIIEPSPAAGAQANRSSIAQCQSLSGAARRLAIVDDSAIIACNAEKRKVIVSFNSSESGRGTSASEDYNCGISHLANGRGQLGRAREYPLGSKLLTDKSSACRYMVG
jgi:hypothetical protein